MPGVGDTAALLRQSRAALRRGDAEAAQRLSQEAQDLLATANHKPDIPSVGHSSIGGGSVPPNLSTNPSFITGSNHLVGANQAVIDPRKLTEYALNPAHPVGGNKARVFESALGFTKDNADDLMRQLQQGVVNHPAIPGKVNEFGTRFTVDIPVTGPRGSGVVRSGWIYKPGSNTPELTTIFVK